jgi:hypothetical protein
VRQESNTSELKCSGVPRGRQAGQERNA